MVSCHGIDVTKEGYFAGDATTGRMIAFLLGNSPRSPLGNINIFSDTPVQIKLRYFSPPITSEWLREREEHGAKVDCNRVTGARPSTVIRAPFHHRFSKNMLDALEWAGTSVISLSIPSAPLLSSAAINRLLGRRP